MYEVYIIFCMFEHILRIVASQYRFMKNIIAARWWNLTHDLFKRLLPANRCEFFRRQTQIYLHFAALLGFWPLAETPHSIRGVFLPLVTNMNDHKAKTKTEKSRRPFDDSNRRAFFLVFWHDSWVTRWWFQTCFIFTPIWGRFPIWLIFFRWVETTKPVMFGSFFVSFTIEIVVVWVLAIFQKHPGFHWHKMLIGWCIATLLAVILVLTGHLRFHLFSSFLASRKKGSLKGVFVSWKWNQRSFGRWGKMNMLVDFVMFVECRQPYVFQMFSKVVTGWST